MGSSQFSVLGWHGSECYAAVRVGKLAKGYNSALTELLTQRQRLMLVGRSYIRSIDLVRPRQQRHIVQPAHKLPVFHQERNFVGANLENRWCSLDVVGPVAESRIEEPRVMNSKLSVRRIERHHLRREFRGTLTRSLDASM